MIALVRGLFGFTLFAIDELLYEARKVAESRRR